MVIVILVEIITVILSFVTFCVGYVWVCRNEDRVGYARGALIWVTHALVFSIVALLFLLELTNAPYLLVAVWASALVFHGVLLVLSVFIILHLHTSEKL